MTLKIFSEFSKQPDLYFFFKKEQINVQIGKFCENEMIQNEILHNSRLFAGNKNEETWSSNCMLIAVAFLPLSTFFNQSFFKQDNGQIEKKVYSVIVAVTVTEQRCKHCTVSTEYSIDKRLALKSKIHCHF